MNIKHYLVSIPLTMVILSSCNLFAFSVENHNIITKLSVDLINDCGIENDIKESDLDTLVEYNLYQDKLLKKAILWHFPMPEEGSDNPIPNKKHASGYGKLVVDTTFNRWTDYLEDQANKEQTFEDRLPAIGALLHFTQDLAVPAHAVPIFHPSKIANPDKLDDWDVKQLDLKKLKKNDNLTCTDLKKYNIQSVSSLNKIVRRNTLNNITNTKLDSCPNKSSTCNWNVFWKTEVIDTGFAYYGCNKEDMFGNNKFTCNNVEYQVSSI